MGYSVRDYIWKDVEGARHAPKKMCSRCGNMVEYKLVYDAFGGGLLWFIREKLTREYALHCPICINYELISKEKAILRTTCTLK